MLSHFKVAFEDDFLLSSDRDHSQQVTEEKDLIVKDIDELVKFREKINTIVETMVGKIKFQISANSNDYLVSTSNYKLLISTITSEGQCQLVNLVELISKLSFKTKIFDGLQVFMRKSADDFLFESNKFATDVINLYKDTLPKEWINYKLKILFFESQLTEFYGIVSWTDRVIQLSCENIYKLPHTNIIHPVVFRNENDMPIPQAVISSNHNFTSLVLNITNDTSGSGNLISNNQSNDSTPIVPYLAIGAVVGGAIAYGVYKAYSNYKSFNSIPREDLEFKDASSASSQEQCQLIQHNC